MKKPDSVPHRGDIVKVNFSPQSGHEQAGRRPAVVISRYDYHKKSNYVTVCPITSNISPWPWKIILPDNDYVYGAVLTDQVKSLDRHTRKLEVIGRIDDLILSDIEDMLRVFLSL